MGRFAGIRAKWQRTSSPAVHIVCLVAEDADRSLVLQLCRRNQWGSSFPESRANAERALHEIKPQIMLFDRDIAGRDWRDFVAGFAAASSGVCIMLLSKVIDDNLWNDLVVNGGYEVLRKPLREDEVTRVVRMAWSYWSSTVKVK
jgi:DNA-binding NtrC family response regulator